MNRLIEDSSYLYRYDARGNLEVKQDKQSYEMTIYVFNLFNQLMKWKRVDRDNQLIEGYSYRYDALNRRVSKTHITPSNTPNHPTQTTHHYLYDDENIIGILDANKELLASIVHDTQTDTPLSIATYQNEAKAPSKAELYYHKDLTDEELLFLKKKNKRRTYYYHRDHQGSITHLTDEEGKVVESFTYDAYGTILEHTQTVETLNPYGYTGREFDKSVADDTGIIKDLYYYRARYYDPMQGRFISQDPIEFLAGDVNFYRYVGGDPVNFVDPSGLKAASNAAKLAKYLSKIDPNKTYISPLTHKKVKGRNLIKQLKKDLIKKQQKITEKSKKKVKSGVAVKRDCSPCQINQKKFFKEYKKQFKKELTTKQKNTLTQILNCTNDYYKQRKKSCDLKKIAYMLATAKHETGNFSKFHELGNGISKDGIDHYFDKYDPVLESEKEKSRAIKMGNTEKGDGYKYRGRGLVHLTWKNNYKQAGDFIGIDLVNNPEKAADPCNGTKIALWGMEKGKFTGRSLSRYINKKRVDYYNARRIINGISKRKGHWTRKVARNIKSYAKKIYKTLEKENPC